MIQTIGRAARHLNGKAILYADKITGSMQRALDESNRRREIQLAYNHENNITPSSIAKAVKDLIETEENLTEEVEERALSLDEFEEYSKQSARELTKTIQALENKMLDYAKDLDFEKAAELRDKIAEIQVLFLKYH